jgi:hypothetical protein
LALLPGRLTPLLQDQLTHLGSWMPFAKAAALLASFSHTSVSESSAQRLTEALGLAYQAVQQAQVERIERDWPVVEPGPDKLVLSVDGAFVPVLHGEWAEVKTLVVGEVGEPGQVDGALVAQTHTHSYFSRVSDATTFQQQTLGELQRRSLECATQVVAVSDGAEWIQGFIDFHCPDATRILDFAHAAQRICQIGEAVLGTEHAGLQAWQTRQLQQLKQHGPQGVLDTLRTFAAAHLSVPLIAENLAYLQKRQAQMQYPSFQAQGWPIGSGMVESANKLVVEARLKGAGMHWSRASLNPLLALRNAVCNDRWDEAWQQSATHIRRVGLVRRELEPKRLSTPQGASPAPPASLPPASSQVEAVEQPKVAAKHPWRRTNYATKARMALAPTHARK